MRTRYVALLALALILAAQLVIFVNAEYLKEGEEEPIIVTPAPFNFISWFQHTFHIQKFSVVGDAQSCGEDGIGNPTFTYAASQGSSFSSSASAEGCSSGHGMWNVFSGVGGWNPFREYKDSVSVICGSGNPQCNFELYCCPNTEPTDTSQCQSWLGTYSELKTATCVSWANFDANSESKYKCTTIYGTEDKIPYTLPSFNYCSQNSGFDCYYYSGSGTTCTKKSYPSSYTSCSSVYSFQGEKLYSSKPTCEANICVPSSACAANTCVGQTCASCGNTYPGTKTCTASCTANNFCVANTCSGSSCQDSCGNSYSGTKDCTTTTPSGADLSNILEISNLIIPEDDKISPKPATGVGFYSTSNLRTFRVNIKNLDSVTHNVKVEAGFYTENYAKNEAKLFSLFSFFSVKDILSCVKTEPFVKTKEATIKPGETETVKIEIAPLQAFVTLGIGEYKLDSTPLYPFLGVMKHEGDAACCKKIDTNGDDIPDSCFEGTGGYVEPSGYGWQYRSYYSTDSTTPFNRDIYCGNQKYGYIEYKAFGNDIIHIERDYTACITDFVLVDPKTGEIDKEATEDYRTKVQAGELSKAYKLSLTKEEISKSPTPQLLASACKLDSECLPRQDTTTTDKETKEYSISCNSIASLREDGTISDSKVRDIMATGKQLITNGVIGGTIGGAAGIGLCALGVGAATVATFTTGVGGALLIPATATCASLIGASALVGAGVGVGGTLVFNALTDDDELVKALKAGDANGIGICTAEPKNEFDVGRFLKKIGKVVKITGNETTDGIIVIIGGFFVLSILLNMMRGKS